MRARPSPTSWAKPVRERSSGPTRAAATVGTSARRRRWPRPRRRGGRRRPGRRSAPRPGRAARRSPPPGRCRRRSRWPGRAWRGGGRRPGRRRAGPGRDRIASAAATVAPQTRVAASCMPANGGLSPGPNPNRGSGCPAPGRLDPGQVVELVHPGQVGPRHRGGLDHPGLLQQPAGAGQCHGQLHPPAAADAETRSRRRPAPRPTRPPPVPPSTAPPVDGVQDRTSAVWPGRPAPVAGGGPMHLPVGPRPGAGDRARLDQFRLRRGLAPEDGPAYAAARLAALEQAGPPGPGPVWRPLGPFAVPHGRTAGSGPGSRPPVTGRVAAVAVDPGDPRHLLAGGGGVWESRDGGQTWTPGPTTSRPPPSGRSPSPPGTRRWRTPAPARARPWPRSGSGCCARTTAAPPGGRWPGGCWAPPSTTCWSTRATPGGCWPRPRPGCGRRPTAERLDAAAGRPVLVRGRRGGRRAARRRRVRAAPVRGRRGRLAAGALASAPAAFERVAVAVAPGGQVGYVFAAGDGVGHLWRREHADGVFEPVKPRPTSTAARPGTPLPARPTPATRTSSGWAPPACTGGPWGPTAAGRGRPDGQAGRGQPPARPARRGRRARRPGRGYAAGEGGLFRSPDEGALVAVARRRLAVAEVDRLADHGRGCSAAPASSGPSATRAARCGARSARATRRWRPAELVAAGAGGLVVSGDGGSTWTAVARPGSAGW